MKFTYLPYRLPQSTVQTVEWKGYNANPVISDGEFHDCKNLTSDMYPVLAPRRPRKVVKSGLSAPTALMVRDGKLIYVDGTKFYYNEVEKGTVTAGEKQIVTMGDRIIIFPDKKMYDISDDTFTNLSASVSATGTTVFTTDTISFGTVTDLTRTFNVGDGIAISGCTAHPGNNLTAVIKSLTANTLTFNSNTFAAGNETATITITRDVPELDYVCEWNNRLWGVKGNTIYASALGKPTNFNVFSGLASDSYAVDVGSPGEFTGIKAFGSHICCFKETCIHRIYGSKPGNYQFSDSQAAGVKMGAYKSIVNISDNLIYLSPNGIMDYAGSIPELMSSQFGTRHFTNARAGTDGKKYYAALKEGSSWELFVYDFERGLWLIEDKVEATDFASDSGTLYMLAGKCIYKMTSDDDKDELVDWYAELGEISEQADQKKKHIRFDLQCELLEKEATLRIEINQDRMGWKTIFFTTATKRTHLAIPIVPTRCNFLNIRISGRGQAKIYSLSRRTVMGSDIH